MWLLAGDGFSGDYVTRSEPFDLVCQRHGGELCGILGDGRSGGAVIRGGFLLDAVIEPDTSDHLRQLVLPLQAAPGLRGGHDKLEDHQLGRPLRERAFCAHGSVAHGGEHALYWVRCPQVIRVFGREVEEREQRISVFRQARDGLGILGSVFLDEDVESSGCG